MGTLGYKVTLTHTTFSSCITDVSCADVSCAPSRANHLYPNDRNDRFANQL